MSRLLTPPTDNADRTEPSDNLASTSSRARASGVWLSAPSSASDPAKSPPPAASLLALNQASRGAGGDSCRAALASFAPAARGGRPAHVRVRVRECLIAVRARTGDAHRPSSVRTSKPEAEKHERRVHGRIGGDDAPARQVHRRARRSRSRSAGLPSQKRLV